MAEQIPDVPFRLFAAIEKDSYRKPMPGMWYELEKIFAQEDVQIGQCPCLSLYFYRLTSATDVPNSFFIGDAAGRTGDHSSTDRKLALNIGLPFHTPEAYFLGQPEAAYTLPGFDVSTLPEDGG